VDWKALLPTADVWLAWALQAALAVGLVALLAGALIALVSRIPVVGPVLARIIRVVAGNYERWLAERVPRLAEQAALSVEERYRKASSVPPEERARAKLEEAMTALQDMAPGLSREITRRQIEAALARIRASGMEQKAEGGK